MTETVVEEVGMQVKMPSSCKDIREFEFPDLPDQQDLRASESILYCFCKDICDEVYGDSFGKIGDDPIVLERKVGVLKYKKGREKIYRLILCQSEPVSFEHVEYSETFNVFGYFNRSKYGSFEYSSKSNRINTLRNGVRVAKGIVEIMDLHED